MPRFRRRCVQEKQPAAALSARLVIRRASILFVRLEVLAIDGIERHRDCGAKKGGQATLAAQKHRQNRQSGCGADCL